MIGHSRTRCTAFEGFRQIATGELRDVVTRTKAVLERGELGTILIFDDQTSHQIEVDFRGTLHDVLERLQPSGMTATEKPQPDGSPVPRGPGRPKLGVIAREVTLLPRHWDWLNQQPGGASVALRKLVEAARHENEDRDRIRLGQESTYRFLSAIAGNLPGFEEAIRALFAGDRVRFFAQIKAWPADVHDHAKLLAEAALEPSDK